MIIRANSEMYTRFWGLTMYWLTHSVTSRQPESALPSTLVAITGMSRIELAKITGITPDWLTLSGM